MSELRIIGNETVRKLLDATISGGRISHAQLFSAPEGVGALRIAIDYALKALGAGEEKMFSHPDLHYVFPVNTNKDVKKSPVSDDFLPLWQKFVTEHPYGNLADWYAMMDIENKQGIIGKEEAESIAKKLSLKSFSGGYRAVVIWHGEKMNQTAANKLLKLIEEPSERTLIIIVTDDAGALLPTISSRCQKVEFRHIGQDEIYDCLVRQYGTASDTARRITQGADGDMGRALKMLSGGSHEEAFPELFVRFVRHAFMAKKRPQELNNLLVWASDVSALSRESQKHFLEYACGVFRQGLMNNYGVTELVLPQDFPAGFNFGGFSQYVHGRNIADIYRELTDAQYHIERNANSKMVFFDTAVKITRYLHAKPV